MATPTDAETRDVDTDNHEDKSGVQNTIDKAAIGIKKKLNAQWEKKVASMVADGIEAWRDEQGLDDDTVAKVSGLDDTQREMRGMKSQLGKAEKELIKLRESESKIKAMLKTNVTKTKVLSIAAEKSRDPESVWLHIAPRLDLDMDTLETVIRDENGDRDHDATVEALVTDLLASKPHLEAPTGHSGSGHKAHKPDAVVPPDGKPVDSAATRQAALGSVYGGDDS